MAGRKQSDVSKKQFWQALVQRWESSSQSIREFCSEQGVSETSFYAWRRAIAASNGAGTTHGPKVRGEDLPAFVPIRLAPTSTRRPNLEIVLGSGRVIRVPPDFDVATLRSLLAVLEEASPC
jgi:transposase-like protein